jgi:hypothetical protein
MPTLLFVSDSVQATKEAEKHAKMIGIPLVRREYSSDQNLLHLEKDFQGTAKVEPNVKPTKPEICTKPTIGKTRTSALTG